MKGSVVVLLGCFAFFFAAPSHCYSIKFISEDDQVANRQDTQSGSPAPDITATGDAIENSDTSAGESKTIKMDGDTKSGDESVSRDAQAEKSIIRKRDTRSFVRDMMVNTDEETSKPVSRDVALYLLKVVGDRGDRCFKEVLSYLQKHEIPNDSYSPRGNRDEFTRSSMIRWLRIIQGHMSKCLRKTIEPLTNGVEPPYDDDDTPNSVRPRSGSDSFLVSELLLWFEDIGKTLEKCLKDAITILKAMSEDRNDTVQRSSETVSDLLTQLMEILSQIDPGTYAAGKPDQSVPPYPDAVPVITTYKKSNSLDEPRGYRHYSNLPAFVFEQPPHFGYTKEIPFSTLPHFPGFRGEMRQAPFTPGITTLPEDINALPKSYLNLLAAALDKIYSRLQGMVPPVGSIEVAPGESFGGDANDVLGLYQGPSNRQSLAMEDPDISHCVEECMNKTAQ